HRRSPAPHGHRRPPRLTALWTAKTSARPEGSDQFWPVRVAVAGRTGRSSVSGLIEPRSFSRAYSTSDFHDRAVQLETQSRIARMRAYRLESHREEEIDRRDAALLALARLAELG